MTRALSDLASVRGVHPALPRIGTDFMTLRLVMRQLLRRGGSTSSLDKCRVVCSVTGAGKNEGRAGGRFTGGAAEVAVGSTIRSCFCFLGCRLFCKVFGPGKSSPLIRIPSP